MITHKILLVDDDQHVLDGYERSLRRKFAVSTAASADRALGVLASDGPFSAVVSDMQMPGMNGVQFLRKVQEKAPESVRLMLTGRGDARTVADAVNQGHIFTFLTKPCTAGDLEAALERAVEQYRLVVAERELLEQTLNGSVELLTEILAMTDPHAFGLAQKLRDEVRAVASWFRYTRQWELELAAMLSHVGYVAIPPQVLLKHRTGGALSGVEKDMIARAPETGANLLAKIPRLQPVAKIIRYLSKNFDGTGFPLDSVAGEQIPVGTRILRLLLDVIAAESRHKTRLQAFHEIECTTGRYDPEVIKAVASCYDIYLEKERIESTRAIAFAELQVGDVLARDIETTSGLLIFKAGNAISAPLLQKLRNFACLNTVKEPVIVHAAEKREQRPNKRESGADSPAAAHS